MKRHLIFMAIGFSIVLSSCNKDPKKDLFELIDSEESGLDFSNVIVENDSVNPSECLNCFNGGGVGIGDFNSDGLSDVIFTGNQVSSALYLNKGNLKFEDITKDRLNYFDSSWGGNSQAILSLVSCIC